jgi:hypothetical protein
MKTAEAARNMKTSESTPCLDNAHRIYGPVRIRKLLNVFKHHENYERSIKNAVSRHTFQPVSAFHKE